MTETAVDAEDLVQVCKAWGFDALTAVPDPHQTH